MKNEDDLEYQIQRTEFNIPLDACRAQLIRFGRNLKR